MRVPNLDPEELACTPELIDPGGFNPNARIPYGCTTEHISLAMRDFIAFLGFINTQLHTRSIQRFETMLMAANFSSLVGEFVAATIPKYCPGLVRNGYHNGHPDLVPAGKFPKNSVQYAEDGIEIKSSRYDSGWQGHNAEDCWLMVFVFTASRGSDGMKQIEPIPFRFDLVCGAKLSKDDWLFSGRSAKSRRTITASVTKTGYEKMMTNWIYKSPRLRDERQSQPAVAGRKAKRRKSRD